MDTVYCNDCGAEFKCPEAPNGCVKCNSPRRIGEMVVLLHQCPECGGVGQSSLPSPEQQEWIKSRLVEFPADGDREVIESLFQRRIVAGFAPTRSALEAIYHGVNQFCKGDMKLIMLELVKQIHQHTKS